VSTPPPKVSAERTSASFTRYTPSVGTFTFPVVKVAPPEKVEVAESPRMVVVAVRPM